jgi:hypothetical protein
VNEGRKAAFRKSGAGISRKPMYDLLIATVEENVGHRFFELAAPRYGEQMLLALGPGDFDEIAGSQARGLGQDRTGDRDLVVPRQPPDHLDRRIVDRRQVPAQLDQSLGLDTLDQMAEDIVEQADLRLIEAIGIVEKKVGDAPKRFDAFLGRAAFDRVFELGDNGLMRAHPVRLLYDSFGPKRSLKSTVQL